jgi:hypothetical protein
MVMPTVQEFRGALKAQFERAEKAGRSEIDINSGELHRAVGGYPSADHRMPVCCGVMEFEMRAGDTIISAPPSKRGASLTIRYKLPR